jgi:hypothetical protein
MSTLSHIELELAREPGHPLGDRNHSYHLYLPLTEEGRIDGKAWHKNPAAFRVRRRRPNEEDARGRIVHGPGGRWTFDYLDETDGDNEIGFRFGEERFVTGEYVSIREDDGKTHVFQVIAVRPA